MSIPGIRKLTNFLAIISLLSFISCSKEKDTLPARLYHSTTSYFNGYYNADYLFKETVNRLEAQYSFPEQGFIEVVYYGDEDEIKSFVSDFETITKKNDRVLFKHPNGNFVDNCRLLNGKSWFYRQSYDLALQNFDYVLDSFPDSDLSAETWFWIAQTQYQLENPEIARTILDEQIIYKDSIILTKDLQEELGLFLTRLAIDEKDYPKAAKTLEENIELVRNKKRQARSHFLLGQLYAENNNFAKSLEQFSLVGKYSDDYTLTFLSKIRIARLYVDFMEGEDGEKELVAYLNKLLKDEKNEEFQDRIYYEFAMLELKKENRDAAIEYLQQSIRVNVGNQRQKALSYYKIGQINYYDLQDYPTAQVYYDSAAAVINPDAPEYDEIKTLAETLKEYITHLTTIEYQDSMLWLAELPKAELDTIVNRLVAEEERKKKEALEAQLASMQQNNNNNDPFFNPMLQQQQQRNNRQRPGAAFYFDNPNAVTSGKIQFEQTWGKRNNEDNWRRSNRMKTFASTSPDAPGAAGSDPAAAEVDSSLLEKYGDKYQYYKDIPTTDEEKQIAQDKIEEAMYKLGQIYSQKLGEPDSAIKTFEGLLDRYEDTEFTLQTRYALYQLYSERKDRIANVHKSIILNEYPNTVYAYLIQGKDPNELKRNEEDFLFAYEGLFNAYFQEQYETSLGFSEFLLAQSQFNEDPAIDMARLQYIRGMSYGFIGDQDSLVSILTYVVNTYPDHEVTPKAQQTLNYIKNGIPVKAKEQTPTENATQTDDASPKTDPNNPKYKGFTAEVKPSDKIFVLMYVDKNKISKADANSKVSDFNKKYYAAKKLKVFTFLYKQSHLLPYISNFREVAEAQKYISDFKGDDLSKDILTSNDEKIFYISHTNFKVAYGQKRMTDYIEYYENILSKK